MEASATRRSEMKPIRVLMANRPRLMRELMVATSSEQPDIEIDGEVQEDSAILCVFSGFAAAQDRQAPVAQSSELGRENLSRVAASAADIKAVLLKDTGLLVELKRWVAKDATGHGQIISDADLTDDAMFDRLETDVAFRSVATWLVQKYGYLVPKLN